jgi:hypothetical protein
MPIRVVFIHGNTDIEVCGKYSVYITSNAVHRGVREHIPEEANRSNEESQQEEW